MVDYTCHIIKRASSVLPEPLIDKIGCTRPVRSAFPACVRSLIRRFVPDLILNRSNPTIYQGGQRIISPLSCSRRGGGGASRHRSIFSDRLC